MTKRLAIQGAAAVIGLACAGAAMAQDPGDEMGEVRLPPASVDPESCRDIDWHPDLKQNHPRLVESCLESVVVDGRRWARFSAKFEQVERDGDVRFMLHDRLDTRLGEVTIEPAPGQVAYIDDRRTEFDELHYGQEVSLYVPEGYYGFASVPGAPMNRVARAADRPSGQARMAQADTSQPRAATSGSMVDREADPVVARLPDTAGPLPWLAAGGIASLLAGFGVGAARRRRDR